MRAAQLIIVILLGLGIGAWFWLRIVRSKGEREFRLYFPIILVAGLFIRCAYFLFTPVFYAPDEEPHFNYVRELSEQRAFPVQTGKWGDGTQDWEDSQPPLYYLLLVPIYRAAEALFGDRTATVLTLRSFSVVLWLMNVWLGMRLLKQLQIQDDSVRLFVFSLACLLPTYTFVSAAINNDNLVTTWGGALLCLMASSGRSLKLWLVTGLVLGLALLTKQSAVVFIPGLIVLALVRWLRKEASWSESLAYVAMVLGCAAVLYWPWAMRNLHVYGTFTPEYLVPTRMEWPSMIHGFASAVHNLVKTFWAVSGISNNIGYPFPAVGMAFLVLCVIWFSRAAAGEPDVLNRRRNYAVLAAFLVTSAVNILLVLRFGYLFGMGQGRHLFPILYPIALILAAVWRFFPVRKLDLYSIGAWLVYAFSFLLFSLWHFP